MQMHQLDARVGRMLQILKGLSVRRSIPVADIRACVRGAEETEPFENGAEWGQDAAHDWMDFSFTVTTPGDYHGEVTLSVVTGREGLPETTNPQFVVWVNGRIEQAFDTRHTSLRLSDRAVPGKTYEIVLQGYANSEYPGWGPQRLTPPRLGLFINDVCADVQQLVYDLDVVYQAAMLEEAGSRSRECAWVILSDALNLLDLRNLHSVEFYASVEAAREYLRTQYYGPLAKQIPESYADVVGHTHIDVSWLWDLYQTRHKAVRSYATVLKLMERYPEFTFMASQAQLYQFVKEDQPELYARIQQAVADGRWEAEGGMWVEADCNLPSGESLVRQLLYGNEFFETEFGRRSRVLWLPDVFGYSAALPQILKKSGINYFFTSKLSWSEFDLVPYDTFQWKGIDGSTVLTHFTPARDYVEKPQGERPFFTTYSARLSPLQVKGGWQRFQQKGLDTHFLISYGYGDGGGGPTEWMLENARRMHSPVQGLPAVRHTSVRSFFEQLEKRVEGDRHLPKWSGELYLECHRGTYTAMARNKRSNRLMERELRETELWREYAFKSTGLPYPNEKLRSIWRRTLTLQFHDILPGSSIKKVYDDSQKMYEELFAELKELKEEAHSTLSKALSDHILLYNSSSRVRDDIVCFQAQREVAALEDVDGIRYPVQHLAEGACAFVKGLAPMGATQMRLIKGTCENRCMDITTKYFHTPYFEGEFDRSMRIISLIDKRCGRQLVKEGQVLNRIVCYENLPHNYDAWDINIYYHERYWEVDELLSARIVEQGPVLTKIRCEYRFNRSSIVQTIVFYQEIDRIDFETQIDWKESNYLLKAHFPVDIFYNEATYDIQFGNIKRPTHQNTSWDKAKFEVCAHKWMDVSEGNYGFSLLNDCKYGHSADENAISLTLLKSSTAPNPEADQELHWFTYSIMPHSGDWRMARTPDMAYRLNIPITAVCGRGGRLPSLLRVDCENVMVEAVKHSLRGNGTVIRLYECFGQRSHVKLELGWEPKAVYKVSLMEDIEETVDALGGRVEFEVHPYEIVSFLAE